MSNSIINGVNVPFIPVGGVNGVHSRPPVGIPEEKSFQEIFQKELRDIKFSKHATERLESRNMKLSGADLNSIEKAVNIVEEKGARDSLIFLRDMAFIVNIKNRTIITAIDQENLKQNVFTNIDSAIVAE